ncbi:DUF4240 domain-containing protein [Roseiconus nitratireducens]|uniref:DUF4240 domain-containing protein n=1 Tax=Roseiconus nitratireducens TaxID=2605748 RepID=A0A5M6D1U8_9BACT|nr:DUF4240 domain-containing protein [Roseiconus nitratireducens]KAA5541464.1 DUF4240 domain-containing protein [Roseiconus nitratireducens]
MAMNNGSKASMDESTFWAIIESAGSPDRCSPDEQCERITEALASLSQSELVGFENRRNELLHRAYTWPMIKACFVVLSYVSDDVFEDFRHWLILNGRERFEAAVKDPDSMADFIDVEDPAEEISGEPLLFVVDNAWHGDIEEIEEQVEFPEPPDISDDWPPKETLQAEFPKLFEGFWDEDRISEIHGD